MTELNFQFVPVGNLEVRSLKAHITVRSLNNGKNYRIVFDKLQVSDFKVNLRGKEDFAKILRDNYENNQYITVVEKMMTTVLYRLVKSSLP